MIANVQLHTCSRRDLETIPFTGPTALVSFQDPGMQPAVPCQPEQVLRRLNIACHDIDEAMPNLTVPTNEQARSLLEFAKATKDETVLAFQCEAGVGRSRAAQAAVAVWMAHVAQTKFDPTALLEIGTHNRLLYRLILEAGGVPIPPEPLVSIAVRVKYPADRLQAFLLSMKRQRYKTWEVVAVTDGPRPDVAEMVAQMNEPRVCLIQTREARGRWGHPYRQMALDECCGDIIGCNSDDNLLLPGAIEQMVLALQKYNALLVLCDMVHSYAGWATLKTQPQAGLCDLGCWLAKAELVRQVPWPGNEFRSDTEHVERMAKVAGKRVAKVNRPLFVHC